MSEAFSARDAQDSIQPPRMLRVRRFDEFGVQKFTEEMSQAHTTGQAVIPVIIDSYGGDVYALLGMVDVIKAAQLPVATIVQGKAMSCGAVLFSCGTEGYRFMGAHATVMIHDVLVTEPQKKAHEIIATADEVNRINRQLWRLMEENIGLDHNHLWDMVMKHGRSDHYLSAKQCLKMGFANHIGIPRFHTSVTVEHHLVLDHPIKPSPPARGAASRPADASSSRSSRKPGRRPPAR